MACPVRTSLVVWLIGGFTPVTARAEPARSSEPAGCRYEATPFDRFAVTAKGGPRLSIAGVPVSVTMSPEGRAALVRVTEPLAFEAEADPGELPWRSARPIELFDGIVRIGAGSRSLRARGGDGELIVDIDPSGYGIARGVRLPCKAITLDPRVRPENASKPRRARPMFRIESPRVTFRSEPGTQGVGVDIELPSSPNAPPTWVTRLSEHDEFSRVQLLIEEVTITGWVASSKLIEVQPDGGYGYGRGVGCLGGPGAKPSKSAYVGPASISHGTQVFGRPGDETPWAEVTNPRALKVWIEPGDDWARILVAGGIVSTICGDQPIDRLLSAWIPREAIDLPAGHVIAPAVRGRTVARADWQRSGCEAR